MENFFHKPREGWLASLPSPERLLLLTKSEDERLWLLFRQGSREALIVLFRRYHREIVARVFQKKKSGGEAVRLADVQDAFGDFVERLLAGKYAEVELKKGFMAFAVHHLYFLLKDREKTQRRQANLRAENFGQISENTFPHLRLEKAFDLSKVIDQIPNIGNRVYRMVLYLIFIEGYESRDLAEVFGKPKLAYDSRSRAMKAFRDLLEKQGILDELR